MKEVRAAVKWDNCLVGVDLEVIAFDSIPGGMIAPERGGMEEFNSRLTNRRTRTVSMSECVVVWCFIRVDVGVWKDASEMW